MEHITALRRRAGFSQCELAARLGVSQAAVAKLEKPGSYPNASKLPKIADALECSIDELFGRSPPSPLSKAYPGKEVQVHVPIGTECDPARADQ